MNQARKRTGTKKVLSMILVLVMLLSLLSMAAFTLPTAASSDGAASNDDSFYRIVHLDCGREYFTKDWIIALINEMSAAGYNQLQLAFGNGGFRFYLNDMGVGSYGSDAVKNALEDGNNHYNTYGDDGTANSEWMTYNPETNALTEQEMDAIIAHANSKGVEIVPMINTPGHMHALLAAMQELGMSNVSVSGKTGCMNLGNSDAVDFTKELLTKYVNYFANKGCKFFNLATDEYSSFNTTFYNYANSLVDIVTAAKMTPRVFNDSFLSSGNNTIKSNNTYPTQVCYWYQGSTKSARSLSYSGYPMINTNHDYYYVSTNEYWNLYREGYTFVGDYNESTWVSKAEQFSNTSFYGSNVNSPAGSMFCIWCNTPGKNNETAIAQQIRMVLRVIGARMQNSSDYSASSVLVDGGFKADGTINKPSETQEDFKLTLPGSDGAQTPTLTVNGTTTLTATTEATWTSSNENVVKLSAAQTADAAKAAAVSTAITGTAVTATAVGAGTATITATSTADPSKTAQMTLTVAAADSALSKVTLPINLWLTNTGVVPTDWGTSYNSISKSGFTFGTDSDNSKDYWRTFRATYNLSAAENNVNSEKGAKLSGLLPGTGTAYGYRGDSKPESYPVDFWKCTYNTSAERQSTDGWTNKSLKGTEFQYIRYWDGNWAYSTDGTEWVTISNVGADAKDTGKNQVNIWYRQVTTVTKEITTLNVDWGPAGEPTKDTQNQILDYAVKYESGQMSPSTFPNDGKSVVYNMGGDNTYSDTDKTGKYRIVYGITGLETADYELYMITLTPNSATRKYNYYTQSVNEYTYNKDNEKAIWVKSQADLPSDITPFSNDAFYGDCVYGGEPTVDRAKIYEGKSLLVTYYVRAKQTDDSLTVHYIDATDANNQTEFYSYNIAVNKGTVFDRNISLPETTIDGVTSLTKGKVINKYENPQYVSSDLTTMPAIGAEYRYVQYKCSNVVRTDDKNVYLYYTFSNKVSYVIDFGLPLKIKLSDLNASLNRATIQTVKIDGAKFGKTDYANGVITYTPTKAINEIDTLTVTVTGNITYKDANGNDVTKNGTVSYKVSIIPATSVYYEDSFAQFTNADKSKGVNLNTTDKGYWMTDGTTQTNVNQALEALGSKENVYGYDGAYTKCNTFSMGSATKVTVDANTSKLGQSPTATFTFTGTGFDVISLTDNNSGAISVKVYAVNSDGTEKQVEGTLVNNYYGYTCKDGKWIVTPTGDNNVLYQIPVIKIGGLDYGTYKVVITAAYATYADKTGDNQYSFWLDAIRVYDPMGKDNATYKKDGEGYPQYIKLHDALVAENVETALFIDGAAEADITAYKNYGPNNEVYLANGQAITFTVPSNTNIASIQIGAKAPNGSAAKMVVNGTETNITSATEMYYEIGTEGRNFTIVNNGNGILSLTNLKITFTDKPGSTIALTAPTAEEQTTAVKSVRALFAAPEQTFEPEHFTAKWSRNVRKGGTATLTVKASADVNAITVNGEKITAHTTKTARSFWGPKETYHVFTYRVTNAATADYIVCALNADGVASDPITAPLTVRPSIRDWWNGIFDKWKH